MANPLEFSHNEYTVAWICALPHEMTAARSALDVTHPKLPQSATDNNTYLLGEISGHKTVVTCLPAGVYGTAAAASGVSQMHSTFPAIRFGLLVGIGGGVPTSENDIRLGDVVVSKPTQTLSGVIQHDLGKATAGGHFERLGSINRPPDVTLTAAAQLHSAYLAGHGQISRIISYILCKNRRLIPTYSRPGPGEDRLFDATYEHLLPHDSTCTKCDKEKLITRKPRSADDPQIHYGLIASGNLVIKDGRTRDQMAHFLGNICFDMEAAGVMNIIPTLVIRGISDYSDSHKNDTWQGYAALAAAAYAKELLSVIPIAQTGTKKSHRESGGVSCHGAGLSKRSRSQTQLPSSQNKGIAEIRMLTTYYKFLGSRLSVDITEVDFTGMSRKPNHSMIKNFEITFRPPYRLSNTMLRVNVKSLLQSLHAKPVLNWSIQPVSINQNPQLLKALLLCDIQQLKDLFRTNKARPTDMVFDEVLNEPIPLLEAILRAFTSITPCSSKLFRHKLIFQFLLDQKQRPRAQAIVSFFLSVNENWAYDQREIRPNLLQNYLGSILSVGDCSLEPVKIPARLFIPNGWTSSLYGRWDGEIHDSLLCALIEHVSGFEAVHTCLFHKSQLWTSEDLTKRSTWYIGILAHTDAAFSAALKVYFAQFRSPFNTSPRAAPNESAMQLFGIERIVGQVKKSGLRERTVFLRTIIQRGSLRMLEPFLNVGIDLDEGGIWNNYLGTAASLGKLPVVASLLGAGASTARALPLLCYHRDPDISEFNSIFSKFMDSSTDPKGNITDHDIPDPIVAILKCNHAMAIRPDSVGSLLKSGIFLSSRLYGSQHTYVAHSYVLNAILYDHPTALTTILEYGIPSDINIQDIFRTDKEWFQSVGSYTWLTLAIELGKAACVKALVVKSGCPYDLVKLRDAGGRSAISLARSLAAGAHPRSSDLYRLHWVGQQFENTKVSLSDDDAILDILRAALYNGVGNSEAFFSGPGEEDSTHLPKLRLEAHLSKPWKTSLSEAFYVGLGFIGMYGVLIGYSLLRLAFF